MGGPTEEQMYYAAQVAFLPAILLLSFGLCQYLFVMYYGRRKEPRGALLLGSVILGFLVLMPLAHRDEELVHHLNNISESCSTLTFLLQITTIGRASNKKVKIRSVYYLTWAAELLIGVQLSIIMLDVVEVFSPRIGDSVPKEVNQAVEDVSLVFIFVFRFYYLALIKGVRELVRTKKMEICVYLLFLTHEYPFVALEASTHVSWEFIQGIYHQLVVTCCIWFTVKGKLRRGGVNSFMTTKNSQHSSQASQGNRKRASESVSMDQRYAPTHSAPIVQAMAAVSPVPLQGPSRDAIQ